jgi:hypothetical protein
MHLWLSLPTSIENGAVRMLQQDKEVVLTDGGYEVRNTRWSGPLRSFQIGYNNASSWTDDDHAAVEQMWRDTNGGTDTFNFADGRTATLPASASTPSCSSRTRKAPSSPRRLHRCARSGTSRRSLPSLRQSPERSRWEAR